MNELAMIWAMDSNRLIGRGNTLPWHLPEDLKFFRKQTIDHAVIMGRTTYISIGKALPKRRNIVLTTQPGARFEACECAASLEAALQMAWETDPRPFIIGGAAVYAKALPLATHLYITMIDREHGPKQADDVFFPAIQPQDFIKQEEHRAQTPGVTFQQWQRRSQTT